MTHIIVLLIDRKGKETQFVLGFHGDEMPSVIIKGQDAFLYSGTDEHRPHFHQTKYVIADS